MKKDAAPMILGQDKQKIITIGQPYREGHYFFTFAERFHDIVEKLGLQKNSVLQQMVEDVNPKLQQLREAGQLEGAEVRVRTIVEVRFKDGRKKVIR